MTVNGFHKENARQFLSLLPWVAAQGVRLLLSASQPGWGVCPIMSTGTLQTGHRRQRPKSKGRVNPQGPVNGNNSRSQEFTELIVSGPIHHSMIRLGQMVMPLHSSDEDMPSLHEFYRDGESVKRIDREDVCKYGTHVNSRSCYMGEVWVIENGAERQ